VIARTGVTGATDRCAVDDGAEELLAEELRGLALDVAVAVAERITRATGEELMEAATLADADRAIAGAEKAEPEETGSADDPERSDHAAATRAEKSWELVRVAATGGVGRVALSERKMLGTRPGPETA
jgi:hypothetical protein